MYELSVLMVGDQARLRDDFVQSLNAESDIELRGVAPDLPRGLRMVDPLQPGVVLVDFDLVGGNGIELIRHPARTRPGCEVTVVSV